MPDSNNCYFLKEEVYFEPLFNNWYAWPYLIAPFQSSRYTVKTHLRLMKSFVKNYQLHIAASKQLAGGDFLYSTEDHLSDIKKIIDNTETHYGDVIALSEALSDLNTLLQAHTSGESIESLYTSIPKPLKGYIELFMDLNHNPSYRIIESLVYRSNHYKENLQSVSFGLINRVKERPFILSTPRIADKDHLHINMNFNSPALKKLLKARDTPLTKNEINEIFTSHKHSGGLPYQDLFSSTSPKLKCKKIIKESRRLNGADSQQALSMVEIFNPDNVYIYAFGFEKCYKYFMGIEYNEDSKQMTETKKLIEACKNLKIPANQLIGSREIALN